jgi:alkylhydroperoxidase/carboxymuconolactone decarboxylase family protein YurZ
LSDQFPEWMTEMAPQLAELDPEFVGSIGTLMGAASRVDDAPDARVRILVAMALDLVSGSPEGTTAMSRVARGFGVTETQIVDVVKVCCATAALQRAEAGRAAVADGADAAGSSLGGLGSLLDKSDPEFRSAAERVVASAFDSADADDDDRLAPKDRYLVALALEAAFGSEVRVARGAELCRAAGANDEEILGVLKIAFFNATLLRLASGAAAFAV